MIDLPVGCRTVAFGAECRRMPASVERRRTTVKNWGRPNFGAVAIQAAPDQPGPKKIELSVAVHLAFNEIELRDLSAGLPVGPRRKDSGSNDGLFLPDPAGDDPRSQLGERGSWYRGTQ